MHSKNTNFYGNPAACPEGQREVGDFLLETKVYVNVCVYVCGGRMRLSCGCGITPSGQRMTTGRADTHKQVTTCLSTNN